MKGISCVLQATQIYHIQVLYTYLMLASVYLEVSIFNNIQILIKWTNFKTVWFELVFQIYFFQYFTSRVVNMGNQNLIVKYQVTSELQSLEFQLCGVLIVISLSVCLCIHLSIHLTIWYLLSGAHILFPWPNLAHTSPTECLWVKGGGHCRIIWKILGQSISSLPLVQSGLNYTHYFPIA